MSARTIDGRAVAARVRADVARGVADFAARTGRPPGLATVLVGDDPASALYVGGKQRATQEVGMAGFDHPPPAGTPREGGGSPVGAPHPHPPGNGGIVPPPPPG